MIHKKRGFVEVYCWWMAARFVLIFLLIPLVCGQRVKCRGDCRCPGSTPTGNICILDCGEEDACKGNKLRCRDGDPCQIRCDGKASCSSGTEIHAESATDVTIICGDIDSCKDKGTIQCGTGDCKLECDGNTSCEKAASIDVSSAASFQCIGVCPNNVRGIMFTKKPTVSPTPTPTEASISYPTTDNPTTNDPTFQPTFVPTSFPTKLPTPSPSKMPSYGPSMSPTAQLTFKPTNFPSHYPTISIFPSITVPSLKPTTYPTMMPTSISSTPGSTETPSTSNPTLYPTQSSSVQPSVSTKLSQTSYPTNDPTTLTNYPSHSPTTLQKISTSTIFDDGINTVEHHGPTATVIIIILVLFVCLCCGSTLVIYLLCERTKEEQIQWIPKQRVNDQSPTALPSPPPKKVAKERKIPMPQNPVALPMPINVLTNPLDHRKFLNLHIQPNGVHEGLMDAEPELVIDQQRLKQIRQKNPYIPHHELEHLKQAKKPWLDKEGDIENTD